MKKYISLLAFCSLIFVSSQAQDNVKPYGKNIIMVSPLIAYGSPQVGDVGVGLAYERIINDYISVKLPVNMGLTNNMIQSGIGLKFYPIGHQGVVRYSIAPTILYTQSTTVDYIERFHQSGNFWYTEEVDNNLRQLGFSLANTLNMTIQKNIYMGVELGLGLNYVNSFEYEPNNNYFYRNEEPNLLIHFGVLLGYRF